VSPSWSRARSWLRAARSRRFVARTFPTRARAQPTGLRTATTRNTPSTGGPRSRGQPSVRSAKPGFSQPATRLPRLRPSLPARSMPARGTGISTPLRFAPGSCAGSSTWTRNPRCHPNRDRHLATSPRTAASSPHRRGSSPVPEPDLISSCSAAGSPSMRSTRTPADSSGNTPTPVTQGDRPIPSTTAPASSPRQSSPAGKSSSESPEAEPGCLRRV
jgi:hypothetical protein